MSLRGLCPKSLKSVLGLFWEASSILMWKNNMNISAYVQTPFFWHAGSHCIATQPLDAQSGHHTSLPNIHCGELCATQLAGSTGSSHWIWWVSATFPSYPRHAHQEDDTSWDDCTLLHLSLQVGNSLPLSLLHSFQYLLLEWYPGLPVMSCTYKSPY